MSAVCRWLDKLGIGAFGAVSGVIVIALFWGLFAIDGLLARAAEDQREAASHFLQAITQPTPGAGGWRQTASRLFFQSAEIFMNDGGKVLTVGQPMLSFRRLL